MQTPESIEAIGHTVEEAVNRGLEALNVARSQVSVDVIEPGGGKNMARVRVTLLPRPEAPPVEPPSSDDVRTAVETLEELLRHMRVRARVEAQQALAEDQQDAEEGPPVILNIRGDDLGILIGRRGETLSDLQYITRLIVTKKVRRQLNLVVDVEGYKARREQALRQLAQRMAERVASTRKPLALEPMPANERRIIHLALRDHPTVTTQSVGQGESRKVTLIPKSRQS